VHLTGVQDGFSVIRIKILMPEKLRTLEKVLRMVGQGKQVDEFELSMNRAAESAAPAAEPIFKKAITSYGFLDAKGIFDGWDTCCNGVLSSGTSESLDHRFPAHRGRGMGKTGVTQRYGELTKQMQNVPFAGKAPAFDNPIAYGRQDLDGFS